MNIEQIKARLSEMKDELRSNAIKIRTLDASNKSDRQTLIAFAESANAMAMESIDIINVLEKLKLELK